MSLTFDGSLNTLQQQCKELARSSEARTEWLHNHGHVNDVIKEVDTIWFKAIDEREITGGLDEDGKLVESKILSCDDEQLQRAIICTRIIRNVVVESKNVQESFFPVLSHIIEKLWKCTSFAYVNDKEMHVLTRTCVQLMSNVVTGNESLQAKFWAQQLSTPAESGRIARSGAELLARLLQSKDVDTSIAAHILLTNCTLDNESRCLSLVSTLSGQQVVVGVLKAARQHVDSDEEEAENADHQGTGNTDEVINLSFQFFSNLFNMRLFGRLYTCIRPTEVAGDAVASVTPSQLTLLKLLDSYLHLGGHSYAFSSDIDDEMSVDLQGLVIEMIRLSKWAENVMKASLKTESKADIDARLVDVHVGLILHLQILISLGLKTEDIGSSDVPIGHVARTILSQMRQASFVKMLVSLLHTLGEFSPAISPFRPKGASTNDQSGKTPPEGHILSSTGLAGFNKGEKQGPSLDNLKRDIVNLIGVLSFERGPSDKKDVIQVQNTVRECGGLVDVLSMTQLDEMNPYIRERAIFTLRALLQGNQASQDFIAQIKPIQN